MPRQENNPQKRKYQNQQMSLGQTLLMKRAQARGSENKVVIEAPGYAKMSAIVLDFARPLLALDPDKEFFEDAITVAVIAWNIALTIEAAPEVTVVDLLEEAYGFKAADAETFREHIAMLVRRKQKYFAKHKRLILDYEITESEDMFHLNIMSELV